MAEFKIGSYVRSKHDGEIGVITHITYSSYSAACSITVACNGTSTAHGGIGTGHQWDVLEPPQIGDRVEHAALGVGTVTAVVAACEGARVVIDKASGSLEEVYLGAFFRGWHVWGPKRSGRLKSFDPLW